MARIRCLLPADAVLYRAIRLEALRQSPEAYGSTFDNENAQPPGWFASRLASSTVFGAFGDTELLGIAGFYVEQGPKVAHRGTLWGMYVRPSARNTGVGAQLVEAVVAYAGERVEILHLRVIGENKAARRLYSRLGFVEYGLEHRALKQNDRYHDEVLMAKTLAPGRN